MKNTQVIIVEDDTVLRNSLTKWLSFEHQISGYQSAEDLLEAINHFDHENSMPTCILIDYQLPGINGNELQSALRQLNIEYPIVFMSGNIKTEDVIDAWRGGAIEFILKPFSGDQLSACLKNVFIKENRLKLDSMSTKKMTEIIDISISPREAEVLHLLGQGFRQAEVAQILGIGLRTIKMYRTSLKNKLNLNTPVDLSRFYDQHALSIQKIFDKESPRDK
jgi:FixJ family two-component response regulator